MNFFSDAGPSIEATFQVDAEGIAQVRLKPSTKKGFTASIKPFGNVPSSHIQAIHKWLENYTKGKVSSTSLPLKNLPLPPWTSKVLDQLQQIPFGHILSYQELADTCGNPKGSRAAGNACGRNPWPLIVPCHRILQKNHHLGGFSGGLEVKRRLLAFENIPYKETL